jgi:myo-inositol 2-dehydrogenase/D-chiro-inositol 1-dehydrogenase
MRVALLGQGTMGGFHAATLRDAGAELAVWDADPARRTVETLEEALAGAAAAVIATPATSHADLIEACVDRALPTFCEKPIAIDLGRTIEVVRAVEGRRGRVQMGFQRRFDAAFGEARRRVGSGELGRVHSFAMATFDRTPPSAHYVPTSGGLFKDMHIHDFDAVRWVLGDEVAEVEARGAVLIDELFAASDDVDTSALILRMAGGALGTLAGARANPAGYVARLDLYGSSDAFSIREDRPYRDFLDRYPDAYRAELRHFLAVAAGDAESPCTVRDALEALRVAEAAGRSLREGRAVGLAEIANAQ